MSRSRRGGKSPSYDYSACRYGNKSKCNHLGKRVKKITNRAERRKSRQSVMDGAYLDDLDEEPCEEPITVDEFWRTHDFILAYDRFIEKLEKEKDPDAL